MITGKSTRATVALTVVALTMMFAGVASAGLSSYGGKITPDNGRKGKFTADVKTDDKGNPKFMTFIVFRNVDFVCSSPPPDILEIPGTTFPTAKVKKRGNKYLFTSREGADSMSGKIAKNGKTLSGKAEMHSAFEGNPCVAKVQFSAKRFFVLP